MKLVRIPITEKVVGKMLATATVVVNSFRVPFPLNTIPTNNFASKIKKP